jgi:hypothetical protein
VRRFAFALLSVAISISYNVPARRAFCLCARLLRFNSETNLVQRQFAFLHFPKAWWEANGWPHLSHGVARCAFRFWLRAWSFSFSAIRASLVTTATNWAEIVTCLGFSPLVPSTSCHPFHFNVEQIIARYLWRGTKSSCGRGPHKSPHSEEKFDDLHVY